MQLLRRVAHDYKSDLQVSSKTILEKEMEIKMLRKENDKLQERCLDQRLDQKKEST